MLFRSGGRAEREGEGDRTASRRIRLSHVLLPRVERVRDSEESVPPRWEACERARVMAPIWVARSSRATLISRRFFATSCRVRARGEKERRMSLRVRREIRFALAVRWSSESREMVLFRWGKMEVRRRVGGRALRKVPRDRRDWEGVSEWREEVVMARSRLTLVDAREMKRDGVAARLV